MNLAPLFEKQKELDERIIAEHGLECQDLLPQKILALDAELGELANEWRGFKFWSEDKSPKVNVLCPKCNGMGHEKMGESFGVPIYGGTCKKCLKDGYINPLLEEYVDCLHFILSIGIDLKIDQEWITSFEDDEIEIVLSCDITEQFLEFNDHLARDMDEHDWFAIVELFRGLGEMLGFTWEEIEKAYMAKNKVNHERQDNGY
jgi:dimeric dUTPase (all-alpha-NTP-PPase superfamily)